MKEIEGIVIRLTHFRDNDMMVSVLTSEKIISFLARGVMKIESKNAPSVNIYNKSRFTLSSSKDGLSLRNGEIISSYQNAKESLSTLVVLDFLGEITNRLILSEDAPKAYIWLEKCLECLSQGYDPLTIALIYLGAILRISGNSLEVDSCLICHQKRPIVAMNYSKGGFICEECLLSLNGSKTPVGELKILRYIFKVTPETLSRVCFDVKDAKHVLKDLEKFIEQQLDISLKSISIMDKTFDK